MKLIFSIIITFTIALRPLLPLVDYAVNYDFIVSQLCENRAKPQMLCNGKCYLSKELAKSSETPFKTESSKVVTNILDVFVSHDILDIAVYRFAEMKNFLKIPFHHNLYQSIFSKDIFHPPLV